MPSASPPTPSGWRSISKSTRAGPRSRPGSRPEKTPCHDTVVRSTDSCGDLRRGDAGRRLRRRSRTAARFGRRARWHRRHRRPRRRGGRHRRRAGSRRRAARAAARVGRRRVRRTAHGTARRAPRGRRGRRRRRGRRADRMAAEQAAAAAAADLTRAEQELGHYGLTPRPDANPREDDLVPIRTPVAGAVVERHASPGAAVMPGTPLFVVSDLSRVWIDAEIDEALVGRLEVGSPVTFTTGAYGGEAFEGRLAAIGDVVNPATRRLTRRVEAGNPGGRLRPNT